MGKEINIRDFDVITNIDDANAGNLLTQFADYAWNQHMGDWFVYRCNVVLGRQGALDGYKDLYLRYVDNCLSLLRNDEKVKLAAEIIELLVNEWELPDRDLKRLGVTKEIIKRNNAVSVLRKLLRRMWTYTDFEVAIDYLDHAIENPAADGNIEGAKYDVFINRLAQRGNYDLLQPIIAYAISNIFDANLEDVLDVDRFFLQENVELDEAKKETTSREANISSENISSIDSLIRWLNTKSKKINGWLADQVDACWDRLGASEYRDTYYSYTTNVIDALSPQELHDFIDYMAEMYEGMEDDSGKEWDFGNLGEVKDLDSAREIAKKDVAFLYEQDVDLDYLLDELDTYVDRPESYKGEEDYMSYPTQAEVNTYINRYIELNSEKELFDAMVSAINDGYFYDYDGNEFDEDVIDEMNRLLK